MEFANIFIISGLLVSIYVLSGWLLSLLLKNASIMDVMWGSGFVILVWFYFFNTPDGLVSRKVLISSLITIWGLRLSIYIFVRNRGKGEDYRYKNWRIHNGKKWWWLSFFKVFLLQGILLWIISMPLLGSQIAGKNHPIWLIDLIGTFIWIIGFLFESIGDYQLLAFKSIPSNKGKTFDDGLWKYSRHPNYFGEALQWWGFYLIAAAAGSWWTIFSPLLITFLLLRVSGISLLEKSLENTKPGYKRYIEKTSAFLPWFPKK
jgi:steroid 5-alpha reductase family enzyme